MQEFILFFQNHWASIVGTIMGLLYLFLEYKANIWMWAASMAMAAFYIYIFYSTQLYASMGIYSYFFIASLYGWVMWLKRGKKDNGGYTILRMEKKYIPHLSIAIIVVFAIIISILYHYTDNPLYIKVGDALTTTLNIVALAMISYRWAEQWLLLIPANAISAFLLFAQNDTISGCLFIIFCIVSVFGYRKWVKMAAT